MQGKFPKINNSAFEAISKFSKEMASIKMPTISDKTLERLIMAAKAFENTKLPKIDNSAFEAISKYSKEMASITIPTISDQMLERLIMETKAFENTKLPKIEHTVLELFDKISRETGLRTVSPIKNEPIEIELSQKNIEEIEILNNKIDSGVSLLSFEWKRYLYFLWNLLSVYAVIISLYNYHFPDNAYYIKVEQQLEQLFKSLQLINNKEIFYEVVQQVHVRVSPNSSKESTIIDIVFPKQKLLLVSEQPYWAQVEYFNEKTQGTVIGWVSKKCVKNLGKRYEK